MDRSHQHITNTFLTFTFVASSRFERTNEIIATSSLVHEVVRVFAVFAVFVSQDVFAFEDRCIQARAAVSCKAFLGAPHGMSTAEHLVGVITSIMSHRSDSNSVACGVFKICPATGSAAFAFPNSTISWLSFFLVSSSLDELTVGLVRSPTKNICC